jgi:glycogen phosphorylase
MLTMNQKNSGLKPLRASKPTPELFEVPRLGMDSKLGAGYPPLFRQFSRPRQELPLVALPLSGLSLALRDRLMERWKRTRYAYEEAGRQARVLPVAGIPDGAHAEQRAAQSRPGRNVIEPTLHRLGLDLEEMIDVEHDAGLGNGGLGRLAACFLDSCASLQLPVMGYGIRYEYGMFRQHVENCRQVEEPDHWLRDGNPWEVERPEHTRRIQYYGRIEHFRDAKGASIRAGLIRHDVLAVPYDTPIPGYKNDTVNVLRLWSASATDEFDLGEFNAGSYTESVAAKNAAENITMVLYPNDASENGKACACASNISSLRPACRMCWKAGSAATAAISASLPRRTASS